jgi:hypothetical protein
VDSKVQAGILAALITATGFLGLGWAMMVTAQARWKDRPNDSAEVAITPLARTADYAPQDDAISAFPQANAAVRQFSRLLKSPYLFSVSSSNYYR